MNLAIMTILILLIISINSLYKASLRRNELRRNMKDSIQDMFRVNTVETRMVDNNGKPIKCYIVYYDPVIEDAIETLNDDDTALQFKIKALVTKKQDGYESEIEKRYQEIISEILTANVRLGHIEQDDVVRFLIINTQYYCFMAEAIITEVEDDENSPLGYNSDCTGNFINAGSVCDILFFYTGYYETSIYDEDDDGAKIIKNITEESEEEESNGRE